MLPRDRGDIIGVTERLRGSNVGVRSFDRRRRVRREVADISWTPAGLSNRPRDRLALFDNCFLEKLSSSIHNVLSQFDVFIIASLLG
jgi:hypothetical protein